MKTFMSNYIAYSYHTYSSIIEDLKDGTIFNHFSNIAEFNELYCITIIFDID